MAYGEGGGGNFAGTGGYGGNFGGYGGASNQSGSGGYGGTGGWGGQFGAGGYTSGLTGAGGFNANGLGNGSMYGNAGSASAGSGWGAAATDAVGDRQLDAIAGWAAAGTPMHPDVMNVPGASGILGGSGQTTTGTKTRVPPEVIARRRLQRPPVPRPKPRINPKTGRPYPITGPMPRPGYETYPGMGWNDLYSSNIYSHTMPPDRYMTNSWPNNIHPMGFANNSIMGYGNQHGGLADANHPGVQTGQTLGPEIGDDPSHSGDIGNPNYGGMGRQFGGPVAPGQQYTVGENGPETLQMGPGGGGQVIPHNPMDRLGSMRPEMMQQFHQLLQQWRQGRPDRPQGPMTPDMRGDWQQAKQDWRGMRPDRPQMMQPPGPQISPGPAPPPPPAMVPPPRPVGMPQAGIAGLSRPRPDMGFGGSGMGQPGVMGRLRTQLG
jgi:hypothetical protein